MLGELLIAGRALGTVAGGLGGAVGNIFNRNHATGNTTTNLPLTKPLPAEVIA